MCVCVCMCVCIYIYIYIHIHIHGASQGALVKKNPPANVEDTRNVGSIQLSIPGSERSLEQEMETHSNILAWEIPWTEKPGGLQSIGSQRVGHDWVACARAHTHTHTDMLIHCFSFNHTLWKLHLGYTRVKEPVGNDSEFVTTSHLTSVLVPL